MSKKTKGYKFCSKCGIIIRGKQGNCSNCIDIERISKGMGRVKKLAKKKKKSHKKRVNKAPSFAFRKRKDSETRKQYYDKYIKSLIWYRLREQIMDRESGKCTICGKTAHHVHHWKYNDILGTERKFWLSPVCRDCHKSIHSLVASGTTLHKFNKNHIDMLIGYARYILL